MSYIDGSQHLATARDHISLQRLCFCGDCGSFSCVKISGTLFCGNIWPCAPAVSVSYGPSPSRNTANGELRVSRF